MMIKTIFKQKRIPLLGELLDALFTTLPIISIYSGISVTIILYAQIREDLLNWFPWMTLWYFLLLIGIAIIPLMLVVYKFVIPSIWHFRSSQMSHLERKIDLMMQKMDIEDDGKRDKRDRDDVG